MKKDFLTVTPESGSSGGVNAVADVNLMFKERETTLNFSATGGLSKSVKAIQSGVPFTMIQPLVPNFNGKNGEIYATNRKIQFSVSSDGILEQVVTRNVLSEMSRNEFRQCYPIFWFKTPGSVTMKTNGQMGDVNFVWEGNICYPSFRLSDIDQEVISGETTLYSFTYNNTEFFRVKIRE